MKKSLRILFTIVLGVFVLSLLAFFIRNTDAAIIATDPESVQKTVEQIDQLNQNPEQLTNATNDYLKREWSKIISEVPVIGQLHKFLLGHDLIVRIIFATNYEFSLTFICIVIAWALTSIIFINLAETLDFLIKPKYQKIIAGILMTIILFQTGIFKFVISNTLNLIFARQSFWTKLILFGCLILAFVLYYFAGGIASKFVKDQKKKKKADEAAHAQEVVEATAKGIVENQGIVKEAEKQ